jgi:hypothetical protein
MGVADFIRKRVACPKSPRDLPEIARSRRFADRPKLEAIFGGEAIKDDPARLRSMTNFPYLRIT